MSFFQSHTLKPKQIKRHLKKEGNFILKLLSKAGQSISLWSCQFLSNLVAQLPCSFQLSKGRRRKYHHKRLKESHKTSENNYWMTLLCKDQTVMAPPRNKGPEQKDSSCKCYYFTASQKLSLKRFPSKGFHFPPKDFHLPTTFSYSASRSPL